MTWHVSPEEWLLDFTSVPRGRVRGGESLDPIDDRLRSMLVALPPGVSMPSLTGRSAPRPSGPPARPGRGEPSRPIQIARTPEPTTPAPEAAEPGPAAPTRSVLDVQLEPSAPAEAAPQPANKSGGMVMPSLTRHGFDIDEDDEADALDHLSPEASMPGIGIPEDDADDLMSQMAAGSQMPGMAAPEELDEHEDVEDEIDEDAIEEADHSGSAPVLDEAPEPVAAPPADKPPVAAEKPAPPPPPAGERQDKPSPPPPPDKPDKPSPPPPPDKPGPPRPPEKAAPPPPAARTKPSAPSAPMPAASAANGRKRGWFDDVFADHFANITPLDADLSAELDAAFIRKTAELGAGQTVLDVACGDGRHCFALANLGLMVTGLDNSLPQLVRASQRNEAQEAGVTLLHGDMRALPRDRQYDVVTNLGSSLGYFETEDQNRQCIQEMVEVLRPGGKLVLNVFNRDYLVAVMPCRSWWQGRGCLVLDVADLNYVTNRVRIHRTVVFEDGRQFEHHMYIRAFSLHELGKILASLNMRVLEISGSRDARGRFYGATSAEIWIVAQRRDDA